MKAIEIVSKTDNKGRLKIDYQLNKSDRHVRVLTLIGEDLEKDEEKLWLDSISKNPAFEFLNERSEDVYSANDGEPFND